MKIYIHTKNRRPAVFDGNQICYCSQTYNNVYEPAFSLEQIRREQKASNEWRAANGFSDNSSKLSYVRYLTEKI